MADRSVDAAPIAFSPIDPTIDICIGCHQVLTPDVQSEKRFFCRVCLEDITQGTQASTPPVPTAPQQLPRDQVETIVSVLSTYVEDIDSDLVRLDLDSADRAHLALRRSGVAAVLDRLSPNWSTAQDSELQTDYVSVWRRP